MRKQTRKKAENAKRSLEGMFSQNRERGRNMFKRRKRIDGTLAWSHIALLTLARNNDTERRTIFRLPFEIRAFQLIFCIFRRVYVDTINFLDTHLFYDTEDQIRHIFLLVSDTYKSDKISIKSRNSLSIDENLKIKIFK